MDEPDHLQRWSDGALGHDGERFGALAGGRGSEQRCEGFADRWAWSGQAFARLQLVALGVSDARAVGEPVDPNRRGQTSDEQHERAWPGRRVSAATAGAEE